jgi:hypothetical protein
MKLYLKGARLAFTASLFEAKQVQGQGKAKFSVASIIEPTTLAYAGEMNPDSAAGKAAGLKWGPIKEALNKAIGDVGTAKWGAKTAEVLPQLKAQDRLPIHDGATKPTTPGFAGNLYMNSANDIRPIIRHKNGAQLEASDGVIYPGCYADVVVDVWAQDNQFGKRVNASLLSVTFSHDGERLAGGSTASAEDYAEIPAEAQAAAVATGAGAAGLF